MAGCTEDDDDGSGSDGTEERDELGLEMEYPEPRAVSTDQAESNGSTAFLAEIQNSGVDGDVGIMLVWMDNPGADPWSSNTEEVRTKERYFDADERREVTFSAEVPDEYDAFGFRLWATNVHVEIENPGPATRIEVLLLDGDEVLDEAELDADEGETVTHDFEYGYTETKPDDLGVEANPIE